MHTFALDKNYEQFNFEEITVEDLQFISGGSGGLLGLNYCPAPIPAPQGIQTDHPGNAWNSNDSLSATVIRNAGMFALAGAIGGPKAAAGAGLVGALHGFHEYYS